MSAEITTTPLRRAVFVVAVLNVLYGIIEFAVALVIGSGEAGREQGGGKKGGGRKGEGGEGEVGER